MRTSLVAAFACVLAVAAATALPGTVYFVNNTYLFKAGISDPSGAAYGSFDDSVLITGWGTMSLSSNSEFSDTEQMFAAGFLEGAMTATRIAQSYQNMLGFFWPGNMSVPHDIAKWFALNDAWMREQVVYHSGDHFWTTVGLLLAQMDGMVAGYNSVTSGPAQLPTLAFQVLSSVGDLLNLVNAVNPSLRPRFDLMSETERDAWFVRQTMCTGAIRYTPDGNDILASHSAWFTYGAMNRIVKQYNLQLNGEQIANQQMVFSSYPGFLVSLDDYYIMKESGLTMVQTTNAIFNNELLDLVNTSSLLSWVSVRLANHMATSGPEWFKLDAKLNSGLYSNQYMVIDRKLFVPGQPLAPNTLWVMDQIPGLTEGTDLTDVLADGYYGSYNVPWRGHVEVTKRSGYNTQGPSMSYDLAPRAILFRAYAQNITDIATLMFFARYNDYLHDPLEGGNPMNAIASRGDLASPPGAFGAIDSKVSNITMMESLAFYAINGPTSVQLPVFTWTAQFNSTVHEGCPQTYDFDWELFQPSW